MNIIICPKVVSKCLLMNLSGDKTFRNGFGKKRRNTPHTIIIGAYAVYPFKPNQKAVLTKMRIPAIDASKVLNILCLFSII